MLNLDIRTVLLSYTLCNLICAVVTFSLWRQNRMRFSGLGFCMSNFALNFVGLLLLSLRGIISDFLSILVANVLLAAGTLFLFIGLSDFLQRKYNQIHNFILLGIYVALQAWFTYVHPDLQARTILFSSLIVIYVSQMVWMLSSIKDPFIHFFVKELRIISYLFLFLGVGRIIYAFFVPMGNDLIKTGYLEAYIFLGFQIIYLSTTFYFFLMVNKRLVHILEEDIIKRQHIEIDLISSQEKFYKAFHASPASVLISRVADGKFIDINEKFQDLTGYSREELLSSNLRSLGMWVDITERDRMIQLLRTEGTVRDFEFLGKVKSGEIVTLSFSGEIIKIGDDDCVLSMLLDITENKQIEAILKMQITLWEYSVSHTSGELMQKVLDEIESLTNSKISFFHFLDAKTNSLQLQAWSTQTKENFCKAEGEGMHYPVDKAGVWCDAVRLKRPVIHNDYDSMIDKKGMPEGHAQVVRELVVPIVRDNVVKAVLGIGNKPANYHEKDVELVTNIANIAWFVIVEKQADEEIQMLNEKLELLALTDELTNIYNRRAFFMKGAEEIIRARRYHLPLSIIMLDIDRFKLINDTLGHDSGDYALQCVAATLVEGVREVDVVGRLGGEEFGILLPNTKIEDAQRLAERLRQRITENSELKCKLKMNITASFGVADYQLQIKDLDELLKNADTAMYKAKNLGRNRVELFNSENA